MEIHLVRHGETPWSATGRHTSTTEVDLTARGERQARALAGHLELDTMDLVLSSPRLRARRTAHLAGVEPERLELTDDLAEWDYGDYEGLTREQIRADVPDWTIWTGPVPGGECAAEVMARVQGLIKRLRDGGYRRVLCCAHGHSLRALTLVWLGLDLSVGERFPLQTGAVAVLGDQRGTQSLLVWNRQVEADR